MTHVKLTIDDQVMMDGDTGQWKNTPPTAVQHLIRPGAKPQPYLQAALSALMEAVLTDTQTAIEVHTNPAGWNVRVTRKGA